MYYCPDCKLLCNEQICPNCEKKDLPLPGDTDFCFLAECERALGEMVAEALHEEHITCAVMPCGTGVHSAFALPLEHACLFVPYQYYDVAQACYDTLSGDATTPWQEKLLANFTQWHTATPRVQKKIRKKLKLTAEQDLFAVCKDLVANAKKIAENGRIGSCTHFGTYLVIETETVTLMFNSATYELLCVTCHKK